MTVKKQDSKKVSGLANQCSRKQHRKGENPIRFVPAADPPLDNGHSNSWICKNSACRAVLSKEDTFCRRCSCCICHLFDDNKDPSLWLVCSESSQGDSCGLSCHIECALQHEKVGVVDHGQLMQLDGGYCCASCGKVTGILGCWKKQLNIAKDARRVDVLCYRIYLSYRLLNGTLRFKELHDMVQEAKAKLEKEVGPVNGVSSKMVRGIVSRLPIASDVQNLCSLAIEKADELLATDDNPESKEGSLPAACKFVFEEITDSSVKIILLEMTNVTSEDIKGYKLWYYKTRGESHTEEPVCVFPNDQRRILISNLQACTEYTFRIVSFTDNGDLGHSEAKCFTKSVEIFVKKPTSSIDMNTTKEDTQSGGGNESGSKLEIDPSMTYSGFKVRDLGKILHLAWAQEQGCFEGFCRADIKNCCGQSEKIKNPINLEERPAPPLVSRDLDLNVVSMPDLNEELTPPFESSRDEDNGCTLQQAVEADDDAASHDLEKNLARPHGLFTSSVNVKSSQRDQSSLWTSYNKRVILKTSFSAKAASVEVGNSPVSTGTDEDDVLKALSQIIDPDFGTDIVTCGFVKDLKIDKALGEVSFRLELTTPACPIKDVFEQKANEVVAALPWVKNVNVTMSAQPAKPLYAEQLPAGLQTISNIIAVSSCKGGVGKSTVAVNLAYTLADMGARVGIFDADVYGPSLPTMVSPENRLLEMNPEKKTIIPTEYMGVKLVSFGFAGQGRAIMRGPMVSGVINQLLTTTEWGELDYLVIDMPPGTGDIQLTLCQIVPLTAAVIVTTPQKLSFIDVAKGVRMFSKLKVPCVAVVENMCHFDADGKRYYPFGRGSGSQVVQQFGIPNLFDLPIRPTLSASGDSGMPEVVADPQGDVSKIFQNLGVCVVQQCAKIRQQVSTAVTYDKSVKAIKVKVPDSDEEFFLHPATVRRNDRSAQSVDEWTGDQKLQYSDVPEDIEPEEIRPMGNYAVSINWPDGFSQIAPYEQLQTIERLVGV